MTAELTNGQNSDVDRQRARTPSPKPQEDGTDFGKPQWVELIFGDLPGFDFRV